VRPILRRSAFVSLAFVVSLVLTVRMVGKLFSISHFYFYFYIRSMKKLSLLVISMISVAGCGGGNAPDSGSGATVSALGNSGSSETTSVQGQVKVCPAASSSKAKVSLAYGEGQKYEATTDANGNYVLKIDPSKFDGVNPVALTVESENCAPETIFIENIASSPAVVNVPMAADTEIDASSSTTPGSSTTSGTVDFSTGAGFTLFSPPSTIVISGPSTVEGSQGQGNGSTIVTTMRDLKPNEFFWQPLTHLGDDRYGGPANSRLQVAASGLTTSQPVGVLTQNLKDQFKTARVEFFARGMQKESLQCATEYNNQVGLSATGASVSSPIVKVVRPEPKASASNGDFTWISVPVDLTDFPVGSTINFVASTGQCMSGGTDYDDFEVTGVTVRFVK